MNKVLKEDFDNLLNSHIDFNSFKNRSILITGATGLIGSLAVRFFLYANCKLNLKTEIFALVRNKKKANKIYRHYSKANLHYVLCDLAHDEIAINSHIDFVIHAASVTNSKLLISKPVDAIRVAVNGTEKLLNLAVKNKTKSFVYISSMEVYGQPHVNGKVHEDNLGDIDLTNPRSCYPEGKRMCECMCEAYKSQYGLNTKMARLAQTFGAGVLPGENRVFAQFAWSIINHQDIVLHTNGQSEGNYVYTADALKAILMLLVSKNASGPYNVVNERSHTTIKGMAELLIDQLGDGKQKVVVDVAKRNMGYAPAVRMTMSSEKISTVIGWHPITNLMDSYRRMISCFSYEDGEVDKHIK